jgi:hypothetical protein
MSNEVFSVWLVDLQLFVLNRGRKSDYLQILIFVYVCSTRDIFELKTRFETWITRNDVNGVRLFHLLSNNTYGLPVVTRKPNVQNKYFMFDWSIFTQFVLNRGWKRYSLQIMVFVNVCSTWNIVELKTRFETWITRNEVNGVRLFHLSYLITLMGYVHSQRTPNVQIEYFMFHWSIYRLFDSLEMVILVNVCSTWSMVQRKPRFETWITPNDINGVNLFHLSYLITFMVYLRSQQTPNVQIQFFMCDWSIFTLFVLNRGWKCDSLQIMIFVYVCSTWSTVELKTRLRRE